MPWGSLFVQGSASGLLMGFVYALIAAGLSLIFGLMEIVNFAHGEFLMLSMFTAFWLATLFAMDPILSLPVCGGVLFVVGYLSYRGIISRILAAPMLIQIFATFGLSVFLRSLAQFLWTPDYRVIQNPWLAGRIAIGPIFIGLPQLAASLLALLAFGLLYWFIARTETGRAIRATSEDREAAGLMGINGDRIFALGWGIGGACVGLAGALLSTFYYIFPDVGFLFGLIAYVTVALGGFGSIPGALVAGVIIGLVESWSGLFLAPAFKYTGVFSLYLAVVLVRPQGLMGRY
jgi:branched-chain amino acid transport system permease protein